MNAASTHGSGRRVKGKASSAAARSLKDLRARAEVLAGPLAKVAAVCPAPGTHGAHTGSVQVPLGRTRVGRMAATGCSE